MRSLVRTSLGMLGLALIAPMGVGAQTAPAYVNSGYQVAAPAPAGPVAKPAAPAPAPAAEARHRHWGRTSCAACAAKANAMNPAMGEKIVGCEHYKPGDADTICASCRAKFAAANVGAHSEPTMNGRIVGCEHSKNGVCAPCAAALNLPGGFVMAGGQPAPAAPQPAEAPGRAVASSDPTPSPSPSAYASRIGRPAAGVPSYDASMPEPAPVGVVQANFSQAPAPMGMPGAYAPQAQAMAPGRAVVESAPGRDPYQAKSGPFPRPHVLGHLFGWSGLGAEKKEAKAWKKAEAHAMISYDESGKTAVDELPASMVFGKQK